MNSSHFPLILRLAVLSLLAGSAASPNARAAAPHLLAYEGRITVSGTTFTGTGQFKFALVNADASVTYWSNDGTSVAGSAPTASVNVPVSGGLYNILLGSGMQEVPPAVFKQHDDVHLRVWFNDGVNGFHLLSPDQRIASVGYAMGVPAGSVSSSEIADGSVTAEKLGTLSPTADNNAINLKATTLGPDILSGEISYQNNQLLDMLMMRSSAPDPIEGDEGDYTLLESQSRDVNGNDLTALELQQADIDGSSFFALSAESYYGPDDAIDMELCNRDNGFSGKLYHMRGSDNEELIAYYRLFPMNQGVPQNVLSQFTMRESLWGTKAMADWTVFSADPDWSNWQTHGSIAFFPITYPGGETRAMHIGIEDSLQATAKALEVNGPVAINLANSLWTTRNALEVGGPVLFHNKLQIMGWVTSPSGSFSVDDDGYFTGNLTVDGNLHVGGFLSKSGGGFRIDHPLDPDNKTLTHSFVESPDMKNIYDGIATTGADSRATVVLPPYFEALNKDFRYQLTVVGDHFAQVRVSRKIENNRFEIASDKPGIEVSWQVTGIRKDAWAEANRPQVEAPKQTNP